MALPTSMHFLRFPPLALIALLMLPAHLAAEVKGSLDLLDQIIETHDTNLEKLKTWTGRAVVEHIQEDLVHSEEAIDRTADVFFTLDRESGSWLSLWMNRTAKHRELEGQIFGVMYQKTGWCEIWQADFPDNRLPEDKEDSSQRITPRQFDRALIDRKETVLNPSPVSERFFPEYYFTIKGQGLDQLHSFKKNADKDWFSLQIEKKDSLVHIKFRNVTLDHPPYSLTFDLSKGGNLVSSVAKDNLLEISWQYEWTQVDGVWVPAKATYVNNRADGTELLTRTVTWKDHLVNQPIDKDAFTIDHFRILTGAMLDEPVEKGNE